jgi:hypothetical protein
MGKTRKKQGRGKGEARKKPGRSKAEARERQGRSKGEDHFLHCLVEDADLQIDRRRA